MAIKNGVLYVKDSGKFTVHDMFGYRDIPNKISNDKYTSFPTASFGKIFVAVGILKLIDEHKLSLFSTIGDVLPHHLYKIDPQVTIKELLTHTSGVPDYCDEEKVPDYAELWKDYPNYKIRSSKDLLPLFIKEPMKYKRGAKFEYNNSGFVLLGLVIEAITKKPFDEYLNEVIFAPLKMKRTGYFSLDKLPKNCALGYIYKGEDYHSFIYSIDVKGTGAGGCFTNPVDINNFWMGLFNHKIIKIDLLYTMMERHVDLGDYGYGLGVWLDESDNPYIVGSDPGVSCISSFDRITKKHICVISNSDDDVWSVHKEYKKKGKKKSKKK